MIGLQKTEFESTCLPYLESPSGRDCIRFLSISLSWLYQLKCEHETTIYMHIKEQKLIYIW